MTATIEELAEDIVSTIYKEDCIYSVKRYSLYLIKKFINKMWGLFYE